MRQGALLALAMVLMQHNEVEEPRVAELRKTIKEHIEGKLTDNMTKFGAILAMGEPLSELRQQLLSELFAVHSLGCCFPCVSVRSSMCVATHPQAFWMLVAATSPLRF